MRSECFWFNFCYFIYLLLFYNDYVMGHFADKSAIYWKVKLCIFWLICDDIYLQIITTIEKRLWQNRSMHKRSLQAHTVISTLNERWFKLVHPKKNYWLLQEGFNWYAVPFSISVYRAVSQGEGPEMRYDRREKPCRTIIKLIGTPWYWKSPSIIAPCKRANMIKIK